MASLFEAAEAALERELIKYTAAIEDGNETKQAEFLAQILSLLFELGQEALDENAEWLLLHRTRPLEPVMAG